MKRRKDLDFRFLTHLFGEVKIYFGTKKVRTHRPLAEPISAPPCSARWLRPLQRGPPGVPAPAPLAVMFQ